MVVAPARTHVDYKIVDPPWIILYQDGPDLAEGPTPMDWCPFRRELSRLRILRVQARDPARLTRWVKAPGAYLYRILSHAPILGQGVRVVGAPDDVYDRQLVRTPDGEVYIDDYGLRCFCTTRLSDTPRPDADLRNDNNDYLRELIS